MSTSTARCVLSFGLFAVLTEVMEGMPSRSTLFQQEDQHGITYRIPALLYVPPSHTFLAFAEKRSTRKDVDALYLVLRRGVMDGHSVQVSDSSWIRTWDSSLLRAECTSSSVPPPRPTFCVGN